MNNFKAENQAVDAFEMYVRPEFKMLDLTDEDVISTSLKDEGGLDLGGLGSFEWF